MQPFIKDCLKLSCSDWLDDISPRHAIPQSALTDDDLEKLLNGVYATRENYTFTFWWLDDIQGENFKAGPGGGQITDPCEMSHDNGEMEREKFQLEGRRK